MATTARPLLVPLDGSKNAEAAFGFAVLLARGLDLPVHAVHVIEPGQAAAEIEAANVKFSVYGQDLSERLNFENVSTRFQVVQGSTAETLVELSRESEYVVLASHGRGGFRPFGLGSVADKVVRSAKVPAVVVPGVGGPLRTIDTIMVTLDGSAEADRALEPARRIASGCNARLILFSVVPRILLEHRDMLKFSSKGTYPQNIGELLRNEADGYLRSVAAAGELTIVERGEAATAIAETASELDVDLVVMATSGKGLAGRLLMGSTTNRVMRTLHRPLMIVPAGEE